MLLFLFSWQSHQLRGHWCGGQWRGIRAWRFRLPWRSLSPGKLSMTVPGILLPHLYPGCSAGDASCSCRPGLLLSPCWLSSRPRRSRPTSSSSTQVEAWRWRWQTTWRRRPPGGGPPEPAPRRRRRADDDRFPQDSLRQHLKRQNCWKIKLQNEQ